MLMYIVIGLSIGLVLGLTGAGGSVFAVPLLMVFLYLPAKEAMGVALAAVSLSAFYGIAIRWPKRQFFVIPAILLGVTGVIAAPFGRWLAMSTPDIVLQTLFALLAIFLGVKMWLQANSHPDITRVVRAGLSTDKTDNDAQLCRYSTTGNFELKPRCIRGLLISGLVVGFLSGFLGVGGGFLIIPILLFLSQMPMTMAVGTSLLIIAPVSLSGFASYYWMSPEIDLKMLAWIVAGGVAGMSIGTRLSKNLAGPKLQKIFAVSLIFIVSMNLLIGVAR